MIANWSKIAPAHPPPGFDPSDPASPSYDWASLDASVTEAEDAGLTPLLDVEGAPSWALVVPASGSDAGTPSSTALGEFAAAVAGHYDGTHGAPAVHMFEVWDEPNLSTHLSPIRPAVYRDMVNRFAAAVHAVKRSNIVVAGGLAPFHSKNNKPQAAAPLTFMRKLLCLSAGKHPHKTCQAKVHFDVWSHHPYTFGGPFGKAGLSGDVSLGDLPEMRSLLRAGVRQHRIVHARPMKFWVTEFGWDTNPPRHGAASLTLEARWTAEALHQMWLSGIPLVTWFLLEDLPGPSPFMSGLYFHASSIDKLRAKPGLTAFRFPFVAYPTGKGVAVWGRDETSKKALVTIERRHGKRGHWNIVAKIRANRYGIFEANVRVATRSADWLRAVAPGSGKSLAFALKQPKYPHIGPWGR